MRPISGYMTRTSTNRYLQASDGVFSKYRGKYLAADDSPAVLEGEWSYTRFVLIEFPTEKDLREWYGSAEYQEILSYRSMGHSAIPCW